MSDPKDLYVLYEKLFSPSDIERLILLAAQADKAKTRKIVHELANAIAADSQTHYLAKDAEELMEGWLDTAI